MTEKIYLSPPHMGELEQQYVAEVFASNWIAPVGPHLTRFENAVAEHVGCRGAVALVSGTAAIHLGLRLLGLSEGDEVFCSSLTFVASANPILYQGGVPVFIDSEPESWNMSPAALERAMMDSDRRGKLPRAVIVVNLYGQSADMDAILSICSRYGVPVLEDAAESLGASYKGRSSGTLGQFGVYSFNGNKIITTSGGGMLVSDDLEALNKARFWSTQARDPARHYQHSSVGHNYRMSNLLAAVGLGQLGVLDERVDQRREVFRRYYTALKGLPGVQFMPEASFGRSTRWLTVLTVDQAAFGASPIAIVDALERENIEARLLWKPLHRQPLFRTAQYYSHWKNESFSDMLFETGLCLPSGSSLSVADQARVIRCIVSLCKPRQRIAPVLHPAAAAAEGLPVAAAVPHVGVYQPEQDPLWRRY